MTVLVDWASLGDLRLRPGSLVTASVVDQPLGDVFSVLLPQLGLACRPVGESAVWITTQ